ncbi:MAG: hypothetical protein QM704_00770 [Anaeromyxobacteraceae bacterium]
MAGAATNLIVFPARRRLRDLLCERIHGLDEDVVDEARRIGDAEAAEVVVAILDGASPRHPDDLAPVRAGQLAGELRLEGAFPALTRAWERADDGRLLDVVLDVSLLPCIVRYGARARPYVDAAVAACADPIRRAFLEDVRAAAWRSHHRSRETLLMRAWDDPLIAGGRLVDRGDWRAIPGLVVAFDGIHALEDPLPGRRSDRLEALEHTLRMLGAVLTAERIAKLVHAKEQAVAWRGPKGGGLR